jgi:hypothetical protein
MRKQYVLNHIVQCKASNEPSTSSTHDPFHKQLNKPLDGPSKQGMIACVVKTRQ